MNEKDMDNIPESSSDSDSSSNECGNSNENLARLYESFAYVSLLEERTNACDEQTSQSCSTERENLFKNDTSNEKSSACTSILDEQINLRSSCSEDVTNSHLSENDFCPQRTPTRFSSSESVRVRGRSHRQSTRRPAARQYSPVTTVAPYNAASFEPYYHPTYAPYYPTTYATYYPPTYAPYYQGMSVPCSRFLQCCCSFAEPCCHSFTNRRCRELTGSSCNSFIESCCRSSVEHCCRSSVGPCCRSSVGPCCRSSSVPCCRSSSVPCCRSSSVPCCRHFLGPCNLVDGRAVSIREQQFQQRAQQIPDYQTVVPANRKVTFHRPKRVSVSRSRAYLRAESNINSRRGFVLFPRRQRGRNCLPRGNGRLTNNRVNRALSEVAGSSQNLNLFTLLDPINEEMEQSQYSRHDLSRITENSDLNSSNSDSLERSQIFVASTNSRDCISSNDESIYKCKYSEDFISLNGSSFKESDSSSLENKRHSLYQNSDSDNCDHTPFANSKSNILNFSDGNNELVRNHKSSKNKCFKTGNNESSAKNIDSEETKSVIDTDIYPTEQESLPKQPDIYPEAQESLKQQSDIYPEAQESLKQQSDIYTEEQESLTQQSDIYTEAHESSPQQSDIYPEAQEKLILQNIGYSIVDTDIKPTAQESLPQQKSGYYNETSDGSFGLLLRDMEDKCRNLRELLHSWQSVEIDGQETGWNASDSDSACETLASFSAQKGAIDTFLNTIYIVDEAAEYCQGQSIACNSPERFDPETDTYLAIPISAVQEFCRNLHSKCKKIAVKVNESRKKSELAPIEESEDLSDIETMLIQIQNIERIVIQIRKCCNEYYGDINCIVSKGFISASGQGYWTLWMNQLFQILKILDDLAELNLLISRELNSLPYYKMPTAEPIK